MTWNIEGSQNLVNVYQISSIYIAIGHESWVFFTWIIFLSLILLMKHFRCFKSILKSIAVLNLYTNIHIRSGINTFFQNSIKTIGYDTIYVHKRDTQGHDFDINRCICRISARGLTAKIIDNWQPKTNKTQFFLMILRVGNGYGL